jgi:NAD-dependent SIR2 family protein deacetylase
VSSEATCPSGVTRTTATFWLEYRVTDNQSLELDAFVRSVGVNRSLRHAVLLGAGASISSGIPSASMCVWEWKRAIFLTNNPGVESQFSELSLRSVRERIQSWLDARGGYPPNDLPEEYSYYIEKCFPISEDRRAFFAEKIRNVQPHIGYKLLCLLAEADIISSVWTTNFDGLAAKAAAGFSVTPIDVGIDCQERAFRQARRGELLCVSLHGDYRYDHLKNTAGELQRQEEALRQALVEQLQATSLIVMGYSGRDASVMQALMSAYSRPGPGSLYWCGHGDQILGPVRELIELARRTGRTAFFVPTAGFEDTITRIALHCLQDGLQQRARSLMAQTVDTSKGQTKPFAVDLLPIDALIKSNAFEIECPSEVFSFDVRTWPQEKVWSWLEEMSRDRKFVAVPHRKVIALGLLDDIKDAFGDQLVGPVERTPVTEDDTKIDQGAVISLLRRALIRALAEKGSLATDGKRVLWEKQSYERRCEGGKDCRIHRAAYVHIRKIAQRLHLVLRPTVFVLDSSGGDVPEEIARKVKMAVLGYQHNAQFNQVLDHWRTSLFPGRSFTQIEFPPGCGSTCRFKIRNAPVFAEIGDGTRKTGLLIDGRVRPLVKQRGIRLQEPILLFSNRQATGHARDSHPLRGLRSNRPFDFSLTASGLAPTIKLAVISPKAEANIVFGYLQKSGQVQCPSSTEKDYLIDFPGFQQAFGLPLEIPAPNDPGWAICPELDNQLNDKEGSLELATRLTRVVDTVVATEKPHVIIVFIPARWGRWRKFETEGEAFDLHNFVKAYCVQKGVATQFLEQETLASKQQCRIWWWLSVALYAKAMRTPWVLGSLDPETAFVGLGFTFNRTATKGQQIVLGCSHLYNAQGEGLQFRLSKIENPLIVRKNPHMSYDDARRLAETIRQLFFESRLHLPHRVVIHKLTPFLRHEKQGLLDGLGGVDAVELLEINSEDALRYVSSVAKPDGRFDEDNYPVRRGTTVKLSNQTALVWCHGVTDAVTPGLKYFLGKRHIPGPLLVRRHAGSADLSLLATEILGLSKMDWNSADMYSAMPATIYSSRQIARIGALLQRFGPVSYDYRLFM